MPRNFPRILVIGGGGFIGRHIVAALKARSFDVVVMDVVGPNSAPPSVDWVTGSISDLTLVASAAEGCRFVIFLANASLPGSSQGNFEREASGHVAATLRVAETCADIGVRRFLFASSGGTVYGYDAPEGGFDEDAACRPINGYGVSKLAIEHYLRLMRIRGPMQTLSLRISNPYGEGQHALRAQGVVAAAMHHAHAETTMPIWGNGSVERDFVHILDVADAFVAGLRHRGPSSVINVGSGTSATINDIIAGVRRHTGKKLEVDYQTDRTIDVQRNLLSVARAAEELGWAPKITLDHGLARTAKWWKEKTA